MIQTTILEYQFLLAGGFRQGLEKVLSGLVDGLFLIQYSLFLQAKTTSLSKLIQW